MKYWLKLNEIIYKILTKGPASVDHGSDRKGKMFFVSNIILKILFSDQLWDWTPMGN